MNYRLLFIIALVLAVFQGQAAEPESSNRFYDKSTEHFSAIVGQFSSRIGHIKFADAEVPLDPDTPVIMSNRTTVYSIDTDLSSDAYWYTIEGPDSAMFTANITQVSLLENACTIRIVYRPTEVGSHTARINVYCANAGSPCTYINLTGEAFSQPGDLDGNGQVGISDVSRLIDLLLKNQ